MNAPHPLLSRLTKDPVSDAALDADDRDADQHAYYAHAALAEREAPGILRAQAKALNRPSDWFKAMVNAKGLKSFEDLLCEAMGKDDATNNAVGELLIGESAQPLRDALIAWAASEYAIDIYEGATAPRH